MWRRDYPDRTYSVSSDLSQAGRVDVPVISTERRTIAPYHIAFFQVHVPQSLSSHSWDASITGRLSQIATANSLVRFIDRKSFVQVANCSPRQQHVHCGQHVALADLYSNDFLPISDGTLLLSSKKDSPLSNLIVCSLAPNHVSAHSYSTSSSPSHLTFLPSLSSPSRSSSISEMYRSHSASANANLPTFAANNPSSADNNFLRSLDFNNTSLTLQEIDQLKLLLIKYNACFRDKLGRRRAFKPLCKPNYPDFTI